MQENTLDDVKNAIERIKKRQNRALWARIEPEYELLTKAFEKRLSSKTEVAKRLGCSYQTVLRSFKKLETDQRGGIQELSLIHI